MTAKSEANQRNKKLRLFITIGIFSLAIFLIIIAWSCSSTIRTAVRWPVRAERYKSEVLAQPRVTGEFKHVEWDGWGWASQDTTVYLIFDPTDSLSTPARNQQPGKFDGIPCEVFVVKELERNWYLVQFYTDEW
jgi:hypothetical protein